MHLSKVGISHKALLGLLILVDNILFNLPYDEERYQQTLEACALLSDLAILEDGDESEIGERGVSVTDRSVNDAESSNTLSRSTFLEVRKLEVRLFVCVYTFLSQFM